MDVRTQQIIVQQHMNDRLAEARMARLAREVRANGHPGVDHLGVVHHTTRVAPEPRTGGILAALVDAAAAAGRAFHPTPPIQVRVARR